MVFVDCGSTFIISIESLRRHCFAPNPCTSREGGPPQLRFECRKLYFFQLVYSRLCHNLLDDRYGTLLGFRIICRLFLPVHSTANISRHTDCALNLLAPTSMGNNQVRQSLWLQSSGSSVYVAVIPRIGLLAPGFPRLT
ncbi:hypothetical protein DPMN_029887 [Dreissena polymorpha]|uniref:Uncharacterized protein n=1 Tax=Dreissena polymorpha TaxID=45954 RepID=A0A9D4LX89_DREPO|nr:hypothetical protein DPMN_029887 [Dreissena polymorpha]